ncbi:hypothetical protein KL86DPRO_10490 [uncultured delta proteobacterium]|uniref:Uncharacterized protein n=1 Tax=uncultured delta proteobacterium TaxID=34034 RepID=A0A212J1A1_9DELT|nr:hypothetical protein KL86DPRO_10490 [uncultured delta proteobacterium]
MAEHIPNQDVIELEQKARELTALLFRVCEKRLLAHPGEPSTEYLALASSALTLKKAIDAFLAVEKICE